MRILLIDDDHDIRQSVGDYFEARGHIITCAPNGEAGLSALDEHSVDIVISDIQMPGIDGFEVLEQIKKKSPNTEVIMVTGFGDIDSAVKAMRQGAFDFFTKPIKMRELTASMERTLRFHALRQEKERAELALDRIKDAGRRSFGLEAVVGDSPAIREVRKQIQQVAETGSTTVLITGETGTGKEVVAKSIHYESMRAKAAFVPVDCTSIPRELMESEFFGHEKGAFTDARSQRRGHFEVADEGTMFLDEIGDMDAAMQVRLLRALEERQIRRVGGEKAIDIDVRIVSATNAGLPEAIADGKFREDLYYRLNTFTIAIPPLRERVGDIEILARHFLSICAREMRKPVGQISDDALSQLKSHRWPGNVRELKNTVERAVIVCAGSTITGDDLQFVPRIGSPSIAETAPSSPASQTSSSVIGEELNLDALERAAIEEALSRSSGNRGQAADLLGLSRFALRRRLIQHGIEE
jgi:two-component system, NtrC family, response regulator AtoC